MKMNNLQHLPPRAWVSGLAAIALATAGMTLWWVTATSQLQTRIPLVRPQSQFELPQQTAVTPAEPRPPEALGPVAKLPPMEAESYWIEVVGDSMVLIPQPVEVAAGLTQDAVLEQAFTDLLTGTSELGFSAIPEGTQLLDLSVEPDGVHLNLSREFAQGGGSSSMIERTRQVIFTASSLDPEEPVFVAIEGQPIDQAHPLGGEGLILKQPILRREFVSQYPLN